MLILKTCAGHLAPLPRCEMMRNLQIKYIIPKLGRSVMIGNNPSIITYYRPCNNG